MSAVGDSWEMRWEPAGLTGPRVQLVVVRNCRVCSIYPTVVHHARHLLDVRSFSLKRNRGTSTDRRLNGTRTNREYARNHITALFRLSEMLSSLCDQLEVLKGHPSYRSEQQRLDQKTSPLEA